MAALTTGRQIRGEGTTAEARWADWLAELRPPLASLDALLGEARRLVVVSPHPDDEVLACGGLLAMHAERRGAVAVVAVTDGEASHRGDAAWPPARLADARRIEREHGMARLGLDERRVTRLALPDGQVTARRADLEHGLRDVLVASDCVVVTWQLDGHPDHDATGAATAAVCAEIGCRLLEAPVWMWHWAVPGDARVPWDRLCGLTLPPAIVARKTAALAEHTTQSTARAGAPPVLGAAVLARAARGAEYFFVRP